MKGQCYKSYVDAHKKGTLNAVNLLFLESKGKYEYQQGCDHKGNEVERFCSRHYQRVDCCTASKDEEDVAHVGTYHISKCLVGIFLECCNKAGCQLWH